MQLETQTLSLGWQLTSCLLPVRPLSHSISFFTDLYLASSCDVERGFSRGGLTVSKLRHGLSDESTRAATVLHAWSEIPGLIPESEIIQVFKDKCHRLNTDKESRKEKDEAVTVVELGSSSEE